MGGRERLVVGEAGHDLWGYWGHLPLAVLLLVPPHLMEAAARLNPFCADGRLSLLTGPRHEWRRECLGHCSFRDTSRRLMPGLRNNGDGRQN